MKIFARYALVDATLAPHEPALLLEGSWPGDPTGALPTNSSPRAPRWSLDDCIDARFEWIDSAAARLADAAAGDVANSEQIRLAFDLPTIAYLNALKLRYFLVKLLRCVAFFDEVVPTPTGESIELWVDEGEDDYAALFAALCQTHGLAGRVRRLSPSNHLLKKPLCGQMGATAGLSSSVFRGNRCTAGQASSGTRLLQQTASPETSRATARHTRILAFDWRRAAAFVNHWTAPRHDRDRPDTRRIVFCGNRDLLGSVCDELIGRSQSVCWLYDRFAIKTWLRWRARKVGQFVCNSQVGCTTRLPESDDHESLKCRGIDLTEPVRRWLLRRADDQGPRQMRMIEQIDRHFARFRPDTLILDEDATPFARAAVLAARWNQVESIVVQHGVPCVRFGFAPLSADRILTWGETSSRQLIDWGVPKARIESVGCPRMKKPTLGDLGATAGLSSSVFSDDRCTAGQASSGTRLFQQAARVRRILLLANVPPRDSRADAVSFHLTERTYDGMLQMAAAVAGKAEACLVIKPHPRDRQCARLRRVLAQYPSILWQITTSSDLVALLRKVDCVLSCASSAGIEATLAGVPVIQLMPAGSADLLPAGQWGLLGTARSEEELSALLPLALAKETWSSSPNPIVFASIGRTAAERIADAVQREGPMNATAEARVSRANREAVGALTNAGSMAPSFSREEP